MADKSPHKAISNKSSNWLKEKRREQEGQGRNPAPNRMTRTGLGPPLASGSWA